MPESLKSKMIRPSASTLFQDLSDGEALLLNRETDLYFSLNQVGAAMWDALIRAGSTDEAVNRLHAEFDVDPETLWADLSEFVAKLRARDLIDIADL